MEKVRKTSGLTTLKSIYRNINDAKNNKIIEEEEIKIIEDIYKKAIIRYIKNIEIN